MGIILGILVFDVLELKGYKSQIIQALNETNI